MLALTAENINHFSVAWSMGTNGVVPDGSPPIGSEYLLPFPYLNIRNAKYITAPLPLQSTSRGAMSLAPFAPAVVTSISQIPSGDNIAVPTPMSMNVHIPLKELRPPAYKGTLRALHLPSSAVYSNTPGSSIRFVITQQPTLGTLTVDAATGAFAFKPFDTFYVHYAPGPGRDFFLYTVTLNVNGQTYQSPVIAKVRLGFEYPLVCF
jgi:hypothetical protein